MALKHKLARIVCAWDGHVKTFGYTTRHGTPYECICCERCHKPLIVDVHPAGTVFSWSKTRFGRQ